MDTSSFMAPRRRATVTIVIKRIEVREAIRAIEQDARARQWPGRIISRKDAKNAEKRLRLRAGRPLVDRLSPMPWLPFFWQSIRIGAYCFLCVLCVFARDNMAGARMPNVHMTENEVAKQIVDVAYRAHTILGPGLLESVYEAVMASELRRCSSIQSSP
jgi:PD-(D/E)XK nuclease superfamily